MSRILMPEEPGEVIFEITKRASGGHRMQSTLPPAQTLVMLLQLCQKLATEVATAGMLASVDSTIVLPPKP